jgi:hypothetical protein
VSPSPWRARWLCIALVAAVVLVYRRAPSFQFIHLDDFANIPDNAHLNPPSLGAIPYFWNHAGEQNPMYVPLAYTAWVLLAMACGHPVSGSSRWEIPPAPFHAVNVALHAIVALLAFGLLRRLVRSDAAAAAGAALFALHPLQVEAVCWVIGIRDLLCAAFALVAIGQYLGFAHAEDGATGWSSPALRYALASLAFVLALFSKMNAVVIPLFAALACCWSPPASARWKRGLVPWLGASLVFAFITKATQPLRSLAVVEPLWTRPFVAGDALAFYLRKLVWPFDLAPDYGRTPTYVLSSAIGYVAWIVPAAVALALWRAKRLQPRAWIIAGWFVAGFLPLLGLVPFPFQWMSTVADRYAYLSMLAPALAAAWFLSTHASRVAWLVALLAIALCAFASDRQTRIWRDDRTCFEHTLAVNPASFVSYGFLGVIYAGEGRTREAIDAYERALAGNPKDARTRINLAYALGNSGRTDDAIRELERALGSGMQDEQAERYLGILKAGRRAEPTRAR